jgi:uncharacterized protein (DUF952 family)
MSPGVPGGVPRGVLSPGVPGGVPRGMLFHIAHSSDWNAAADSGSYSVPSLASEGFIHFSTRDQFMATAGRYYVGVADLLLLEIDDSLLDASTLRFEASTNDELFPHYYAALPTTAVVRVHTFACRASDGGFDLPGSLA